MNYCVGDEFGINRDNYETLVIAIITQAVRDVENCLRLKKKLRGREAKSEYQRKVLWQGADAENFLKSKWFADLTLNKDMDGSLLLKKCKENFKKYDKCMFSVEDWDKIRKGKSLRKGGKVTNSNATKEMRKNR